MMNVLFICHMLWGHDVSKYTASSLKVLTTKNSGEPRRTKNIVYPEESIANQGTQMWRAPVC